MNILVAEPNVMLRFAILQSLKQAGHKVLQVSSVEQALRSYPASSHRVDLLLASIDESKPDTKGVSLCRHFLERSPNARVLIMSDRLSTRRSAEAEMWPVLQKPFTGSRLREKVTSVFER